MQTKINQTKDDILISYMTLRKLLGILGILMPFILIFGEILLGGCEDILGSLSAYYHTVMRNGFVAILSVIAIFLFTYKGYEKDNIWTNLAAIFALGVAFFPTYMDITDCMITPTKSSKIIGDIHLVFAGLLFVTLAFISIKLFTKGKKNEQGEFDAQKQKRNRIYVACGVIMLLCMVLIVLYSLVLKPKFPKLVNLKPIFFLESIALIAFGISWLVKGQMILKDANG